MSHKCDLLRRIQQLDFAMIETGMYLNNQPQCQNALALYDKVRLLYIGSKKEYEDRYGPLTYSGINAERDGWSWLDGPWPWEGEF